MAGTHSQPKRLSMIACAAIAFLTLLTFAPIIVRMIDQQAYDYMAHLEIAAKIVAAKAILTPHFLLQLGVIAVNALLPISGQMAEVVVVLTAYAATALIIARKVAAETSSPVTAGYLAIALLLCTPVALAFFLDNHLYFGYIGINVFHNPTIILLKPFALLTFGYVLSATANEHDSTVWAIASCALVSVACALVKPSFTICLLPALTIYVILQSVRHEKLNWKLLVIGIALPAVITLAAQYWLTYSQSQNEDILLSGKSSIIFAPFAVMRAFAPSWLGLKFILSVLFPATVLALNFRSALRDSGMQLAWLLFLVGAGYSYLLAESGPRFLHGNFGWSGQITLFILFVQSAVFLAKSSNTWHENGQGVPKKLLVCHAALLLHVLSGIVFYISEYGKTERFW